MTDQERQSVFDEGYAVGVADGKTEAWNAGYNEGLSFGQAEVDRLQKRVDELEGHKDGCCAESE